jgi:hypothetical protein
MAVQPTKPKMPDPGPQQPATRPHPARPDITVPTPQPARVPPKPNPYRKGGK